MFVVFRQAHSADGETCHGILLSLASTENSVRMYRSGNEIRRPCVLLDRINAQGVPKADTDSLSAPWGMRNLHMLCPCR